MPDASDMTLLREFAGRNSESAFAELVRRHINLVYSVALRFTGNDGDAKDVTQAVFIVLARKAAGLRERTVLTGWLYETTRFTATRLLRTQARRRAREQEAVMQSSLDQPGHDDLWRQLAPHLEAAMSRLGERDRTLLALRYYENKSGAEAAALLGIREEAARKRTNRALEKLRGYFARQGVTASPTVIIYLMSAHAIHAAPAGLASAVTAGSLAGAAGSGSAGLASLTIKMMLMKKTTAVTLAVIALAALVTIPVTVSAVKRAKANAPVTVKSLREGLVLEMPFERDESFGKVTDRSGRGNHGRVSGAQWTADGKNGGAYLFAADGDEIVVSNNASLNPKQLTLAAWIKTSTGDHYWRRVFDKSYGRGFALSVAGDDQGKKWYGQVSMEIGPGAHCALTTKRVDDGQWHHLVMTFDGTNELIYVDGQPQGKFHWNRPGRVGATDFNLVIGCNRSNLDKSEDDLGVSFRGMIGQPMMWNRALSTNEVAFLYNSQNASPSAVASN
jgi:RNA polymerase sigma factor (sigma-70 family)